VPSKEAALGQLALDFGDHVRRGRAELTTGGGAATGLRPGIRLATDSVIGATTGAGLVEKIGAGCGPDCMNSA